MMARRAPSSQKFDDTGFENGVFFGPVASLTFKGPWQLDAVSGGEGGMARGDTG